MFETEEQKERIILVAVATADGDDTEQSLDELEELGQTAGAVTVAKVIQNREKVHAGTYVGKGKIEEIKNLAISLDADTVVVMMSYLRHNITIFRMHWRSRSLIERL